MESRNAPASRCLLVHLVVLNYCQHLKLLQSQSIVHTFDILFYHIQGLWPLTLLALKICVPFDRQMPVRILIFFDATLCSWGFDWPFWDSIRASSWTYHIVSHFDLVWCNLRLLPNCRSPGSSNTHSYWQPFTYVSALEISWPGGRSGLLDG